MMRKLQLIILLLMIAASQSNARVIGPTIYEQKDLGDPIFAEFLYSLSVDCTAATISVVVMNESFERVGGAMTYLKYVDFSSPLLGSGATDKDGVKLHRLPGNVQLMRGLFILVIEKRGFRSKEIHFDISGCFTNKTVVPPPPAVQTPPQPPTQNAARNASDGETALPNMTVNESNISANETGEPAVPEACPGAAAFLLLALFLKSNTCNMHWERK